MTTELEQVLMGTEVGCADGCGLVVAPVRVAYRYVGWRELSPLFATRECAERYAVKRVGR